MQGSILAPIRPHPPETICCHTHDALCTSRLLQDDVLCTSADGVGTQHAASCCCHVIRYHLASLAISGAMYAATTTPDICQVLTSTPSAAVATRQLATTCFNGMAWLLGQRRVAQCADEPLCSCYGLLASINLFVAVLPSLACIWAAEWLARGRFLAARGTTRMPMPVAPAAGLDFFGSSQSSSSGGSHDAGPAQGRTVC